jgi:hypothetical protein
MSDDLDRLLQFDPLDTAEQLVGRENHDAAMALGFALMQARGQALDAELIDQDDTTLNNRLDRYLRICNDLGFETVLTIPFKGKSYGGDEERDEQLYVLAHRDGLLLAFDTWESHHVNGGKVYYNWRPHNLETCARYTSSGGFYEYDYEARAGAWYGDHDAREALRHTIRNLRRNGELVARWEHRPFLWLLHYMDTKESGYDYEQITEDRIRMMPDWVQQMITPATHE